MLCCGDGTETVAIACVMLAFTHLALHLLHHHRQPMEATFDMDLVWAKPCTRARRTLLLLGPPVGWWLTMPSQPARVARGCMAPTPSTSMLLSSSSQEACGGSSAEHSVCVSSRPTNGGAGQPQSPCATQVSSLLPLQAVETGPDTPDAQRPAPALAPPGDPARARPAPTAGPNPPPRRHRPPQGGAGRAPRPPEVWQSAGRNPYPNHTLTRRTGRCSRARPGTPT